MEDKPTLVQDKLEACEDCNRKKTTFIHGKWVCPRCNKDAAHNSAQFILKGEGWPSKAIKRGRGVA